MRDESSQISTEQAEALWGAYQLACLHYETALWSPAGERAREYLIQERKFTEATLREFRVGWADGGFVAVAKEAGIPWAVLVQADLVGEDSRRDRFWQRVMIPIMDRQERPVAFTARILPEDARRLEKQGKTVGKYINTTTTPIYQKGSSVFNEAKAKRAAITSKRLMLVEGALDVIACHQAEIPHAVACLGTAVTREHAELLTSAAGSGTVVVCLDGDKSGKAARAAAVEHLLATGASCQVVELDGKDPAALLLETEGGKDRLEASVAKAIPGSRWHLARIAPNPDSLDEGRRLSLFDEVLALVAGVADDTHRSLVLKVAAGWLKIDQSLAKKRAKARATEVAPKASTTPRLALTDYGNAQRFLARCQGDVLYCRAWGCWVVWDGRVWQRDNEDDALTWAKYHAAMDAHLASEISDAFGNSERVRILRNWRESSDSAASHRAALEHAKRLPLVQIRGEDFDRDPNLLNLTNGILDLRTGEIQPHDRLHRMTRLIEADWKGHQADPRWIAFVSHLAGDPEVAAYLQRFAGYSATGHVTEKAIVILQGDGDSGKTTYVNALAGLFGSYAGTLNAENFLQQQQPQKRWELANADHARLVTVEEVGTEGRGFAIDFLKAATGGNPLTGERKFGQPYTFKPTWKLLFVCNDTPSAPAGDNATWNRINLIHAAPPPEKKDKSLGEHFASAETRSAILAWVVQGAMDYLRRGGLDAPEAVKLATKKHRMECDYLTQYLDENWVPDAAPYQSQPVPICDFMADLTAWCKSRGHYVPSAKAVAKRLRPLGVSAEVAGKPVWFYLRSESGGRSVRAWVGLSQRVDTLADLWSVQVQNDSHRSATDSPPVAKQASEVATDQPFLTPAEVAQGQATLASRQQTPTTEAPNFATDGSVAKICGESVANVTNDQNKGLRDLATEATDLPSRTRTHESFSKTTFNDSKGGGSEAPAIGGEPPPPPPGPSRGERLRRPPDLDADPFANDLPTASPF